MAARKVCLRLVTAVLLGAYVNSVAVAQHGQDVPPAPLNGSPNASNPTAGGVTEEQLFREMRKLEGRVTIPDYKAAILEQPQGRDYRAFHERILPWLGSIAIVGMLLLLALFYFTRGRIRLEAGAQTGIKILRFSMFERFNHWMAATSFIVLALTGLNYVFGKRLLFPLIGPDAFAAWSQWAKFTHNTMAWPFILALVLMIVFWIRDNIPDRYDLTWLRQFGGFISGTHPPARRFNAGQKLIFWSVAIGGTMLAISGILMLFPFWSLDINGMQIAQYFHATVGMLLMAVIIAHIYIGSLGMVGAYDAMGSGEVDLGWARAHHSVWVEEQQAKVETRDDKRIVPAE